MSSKKRRSSGRFPQEEEITVKIEGKRLCGDMQLMNTFRHVAVDATAASMSKVHNLTSGDSMTSINGLSMFFSLHDGWTW